MEAHIVRPRKKQHRSGKDGTHKKRYENGHIEIYKTDIKEIKSAEIPSLPVTLEAEVSLSIEHLCILINQ